MDKKIFSEIYSKYKWFSINDNRKKDIKNNLFYLVNLAYDDIGGNVRITSPEKVEDDKDLNFWKAADINEDPYADMVIFGKKTDWGVKISGFGHDGNLNSIKLLFDKLGDILKTKGYYCESSGKAAKIYLTKKNTHC